MNGSSNRFSQLVLVMVVLSIGATTAVASYSWQEYNPSGTNQSSGSGQQNSNAFVKVVVEVRDNNERPITGAEVHLYPIRGPAVASTMTNNMGEASFWLETNTQYKVTVSKGGFESQTEIVTVPNDGGSDMRFLPIHLRSSTRASTSPPAYYNRTPSYQVPSSVNYVRDPNTGTIRGGSSRYYEAQRVDGRIVTTPVRAPRPTTPIRGGQITYFNEQVWSLFYYRNTTFYQRR